jgi:hypothetical protein
MYINSFLPNVDVQCINLKHRKDKYNYIKKVFKRRKISAKFFIAELNPNPKRGCLESHLSVISKVAKTDCKTLLMLEDDAKFMQPLCNIPEPPHNWDMLYLGGTVRSKISQYNEHWYRVTCFTTHAYIINMENKELVADIMRAKDYDMEIDNFYINQIHAKYNCYMVYPMMILQKEDYSDIEQCIVNYDYMEQTLMGFTKPEHTTHDKQYVLKLPVIDDNDLPCVSILTPTYNCRKIFPLAIHNFMNIDYPKKKIEWIIIDDSDLVSDSNNDISDLIPRFKNIKYIKLPPKLCGTRYSIAEKRNIANEHALYKYRVHMDDDDYYPPESVKCRVKILLKYPDIGCVGCSMIGIYDIINNKCSMSSDGDLTLSEASMGYTHAFWNSCNFNQLELKGEYKSFIEGRFNKIMDLPYSFVIYALSHDTNYTSKTREVLENSVKDKDTGEDINFVETFDIDTQEFIMYLRHQLHTL